MAASSSMDGSNAATAAGIVCGGRGKPPPYDWCPPSASSGSFTFSLTLTGAGLPGDAAASSPDPDPSATTAAGSTCRPLLGVGAPSVAAASPSVPPEVAMTRKGDTATEGPGAWPLLLSAGGRAGDLLSPSAAGVAAGSSPAPEESSVAALGAGLGVPPLLAEAMEMVATDSPERRRRSRSSPLLLEPLLLCRRDWWSSGAERALCLGLLSPQQHADPPPLPPLTL